MDPGAQWNQVGDFPVPIETGNPKPNRNEMEIMNWTTACIVLAIAAAIYILKRAGQISPKDAQAHLKSGALLIDVRSPSEFNSHHLPNAINMPLDRIETLLPQRVPNKEQLMLLHCQSGMRSKAAKNKLKGMGYANAFNLGSYDRAARVIGGR